MASEMAATVPCDKRDPNGGLGRITREAAATPLNDNPSHCLAASLLCIA